MTMKRRFDIPRRTQSAHLPVSRPEQASVPDRDASSPDVVHELSPIEASEHEQSLPTLDQPAPQAATIEQSSDQLSFTNEPLPAADLQYEPLAELPIDQAPTAAQISALPDAVDKPSSSGKAYYKYSVPAPEVLAKQLSMTEQETISLGAVDDSSATEKLQPKHSIPPGVPAKRTFVADQETMLLDIVYSSPPADTPWPGSVVPKSDLSLEQIEQTAVADQETAQLSPVDDSSSADAPSAPKSDAPGEQTFVADQETALLEIVRSSSPARTAQQDAKIAEQVSIADQQTIALTAIPNESPAVAGRHVPGFIYRTLNRGLARLQEPQPEGLLTRGFQVVRPDVDLGLVPVIAVTNAFGLLLIAISYCMSVFSYSYPVIEACFLGGLLLMFVPNLVRLLSRAASRLERICLLCVLGFVSYLIQFTNSPLQFSSFDDFLHWRTADDILRTGHLFSLNSMLPVSPYYPGLELVTNAISTTTGLSTLYASIIVINVAHLLMVLALFLLYEQITSSSRMASIAVLIYMTNSHFIFFDTIYNYETLALPLALFMIYILARYANADSNHRWVIVTAWIVLAAVTITHHMTNYFFDGLLLLWAVISLFRPVSRRMRIYLGTIAISGLLLSLAYAFLLPGNPVWSYLSQYFGSSFAQLEQIISGAIRTRPLFASSTQSSPIWDRLLMTGSVALVTFMLPFGLLSLQRRHRHNALAITFGIAALAYPFTQVFRFTTFGTEITDRATAFLFLPIAYVLTVFITHFWPTRQLNRRTISLISSAIIVILLGGTILAVGPNLSGLPGPYLVGADGRSIEPEGIDAALWSLAYLGPHNRIATDRTNQLLMSTYGDQRILTRLNDNIDIAPIFYSAQFDSGDISLLQYGQIHYLVVDTRLSTALPSVGIYFENDRPTSIISRNALTKFNTVAQIDRLFDSGDIVIYNTGVFISGSSP